MRFVLAALALIAAQQLAWRTPLQVGPDVAEPPAIEALLRGRSSTADKVPLVGRVVDASPTYGDGVRLTIDVESADGVAGTGLVSVSVRSTKRRWRTGDRLSVTSRLRRIAGFGNFGELDWAAYNARRGIFASAYAWDDDDVKPLPPAPGFVDDLRRRFSEACERRGGQGAEILEALTIGDRTGIDRTTSDAVRDAGLAHFLAISGSHMALIVALVVGLVRRTAGRSVAVLQRFDVLRLAAVAGALAVAAYTLVCGGGVSVNRSAMMALAAMVALWRGLPGDDVRALGGSAIVLALAMPGVGEEAGFQLSYVAVAALLLDARRRRALIRARHEFLNSAKSVPGTDFDNPPSKLRTAVVFLGEAARLTIVCWAVTTPIVAHHFQRVSLVAPLANLLAAPLVSAIVVSGIGGLAVTPLSPSAGDIAIAIGSILSSAVVQLSIWCAALPLAATTTVAPSVPLAATLTGAALAALLPNSRRRSAAVGTLVILASFLTGRAMHERWRDDRLDVWFASVGQGDAAIVRQPGGKVWVIDTGPPGRGRMVLGPLLRRAWIGRIDVLVASHLQSDHAGAIPELLDEFDVGEIWLPDGPCPNAELLERDAAARGVPVHYVSRQHPDPDPDNDASDAAGVEILWPPAGAAACNFNDQSLVLRFEHGRRRVLFAGDVEAPAEAALAREADLRADVLKVPHHGSRTSSTPAFVEAVAPATAVISLGLDNQFRFPAPEVEARYGERLARIVRTDRTGAAHLTIERNGTMNWETFRRGE
jgi:competence protein ComEC